ncbi:hypothetical protein BLNAU_5254 [Blattamonas nauphoetae]|uniref:Uncharacterized protein n=1 Tax=Blattamonas nauphoetae TaxID=2049346 RepID=A0ABQ9Y7U0_9EUKA|nr:hypothetical protein BLNAU_5254 [Blattamonas nauphoetae]
MQEPFLYFVPHPVLSFEEESAIYCSLVALVKAGFPFDEVLQNRAVEFLKNLKPEACEFETAGKLVVDLVPSPTRSPSAFLESILTLISSPHSTIVAAALSFLSETVGHLTTDFRDYFMKSDVITKVFGIVQPHTLPISGNETIIDELVKTITTLLTLASPDDLSDIDNTTIKEFLYVATPSDIRTLGITTADEKYIYREIIIQKVVIPSSQFVTLLISNRCILNQQLSRSFSIFMDYLIRTSPFHRPLLDFVIASPIVMAFSSCLSFIENEESNWRTLMNTYDSLKDWNEESPEVIQSITRMIQALFSEGLEDTLEEKMKNQSTGGWYGSAVVSYSLIISTFLGANVIEEGE